MRSTARPLPLLVAGLAAALAAGLALGASQVRVIPVIPAPAAPAAPATPVGVDTSALTERAALDPAFLELRAQLSALRRDHVAQQRELDALRRCVAELAGIVRPGARVLQAAPAHPIASGEPGMLQAAPFARPPGEATQPLADCR